MLAARAGSDARRGGRASAGVVRLSVHNAAGHRRRLLADERRLGELCGQHAQQAGQVRDGRPQRRRQQRERDAADAAQRDHGQRDDERLRAGQRGVQRRGQPQRNRVAEHVQRVQDHEPLGRPRRRLTAHCRLGGVVRRPVDPIIPSQRVLN